MAVKKSQIYSTLWKACDELRGSMDASQYKDYVLMILFVKYLSDKNDSGSIFKVPEGCLFSDFVKLKGNQDIGQEINKKLEKIKEENLSVLGKLSLPNFNDPAKFGEGRSKTETLSKLIGVFENSSLDFSKNYSAGDDLLGDAYEYLMKNFAVQSGKSKGQFYTPAEVSRVMAKVLRLGEFTNPSTTIYDPTCGSGSLLLRAVNETQRGASPFGQEKDNTTASLAILNMLLHGMPVAQVKQGDTINDPKFTVGRQLRTFDVCVANPPFSAKSWLGGAGVNDLYNRWKEDLCPPVKCGDYAFLLHIIASMKPGSGRGACILPHGVLFRGNSEYKIRKDILGKGYIEGIIGLPPNIFFGTGIPACIILLNKKDASTRKGIFLIDAKGGYMKDGAKNRLREQDIRRIVDTWNARQDVAHYARFVPMAEIEANDYNLNIPRYIIPTEEELPQSIDAHLNGGIPSSDIDSLEKLWNVSPRLKYEIFSKVDPVRGTQNLIVDVDMVNDMVRRDTNISAERTDETEKIFSDWKSEVRTILLNIVPETIPKELMETLGTKILAAYGSAKLLDKYDVYGCLMDYWNEQMQDDVYIIKTGGYEIGREVEGVGGQKKRKQTGNEDDSISTFDGVLIPKEIVEREYFKRELSEINELAEISAELDQELDEMRKDGAGEDGVFASVLNDSGDKISKADLNKRIKELESSKTSKIVETIIEVLKLFDEGKMEEVEKLLKTEPEIEKYDLRNKNGTLGKAKIKKVQKLAMDSVPIPDADKEEYDALIKYREKLIDIEDVEGKLKDLRKDLDDKVRKKYGELSIDEIKHLLFDMKWMPKIKSNIDVEFDRSVNSLSAKLLLITKRYEHTLGEIESKVEKLQQTVTSYLQRMGYRW